MCCSLVNCLLVLLATTPSCRPPPLKRGVMLLCFVANCCRCLVAYKVQQFFIVYVEGFYYNKYTFNSLFE